MKKKTIKNYKKTEEKREREREREGVCVVGLIVLFKE